MQTCWVYQRELETSAAILHRGETPLLPPKKQNKPAVYRSKHEPFMKLLWSTYILKRNWRSKSGHRTPATAARSLSMLLSSRAQAGWNTLLKEEGAGQASSPLRQQKAVKRERILEKRLQPHREHPRVPTVLLGHPSHAHMLSPHTLLRPCPPLHLPVGLSPHSQSPAAGTSHLKVQSFQGHKPVRFERHLARPKLSK